MFRDRYEAGCRLAESLRGRDLHDPLVLAVPRGGVVVGAALARELNAELDVVLARKLRAPDQPELAIGGVSEDGEIFLGGYAAGFPGATQEYLKHEAQYQLAEIERRRRLYRRARPQAPIAGRSCILTDDGIATGSTMIAACHVVRAAQPHELIVAVPVAPPERLQELREQCDDLICLLSPSFFFAVGQFYEEFATVEDADVYEILRQFAPAAAETGGNEQPVRTQ